MFTRMHRDERGVALVTALMVGMVVLSLGLVTIQLSAHNVDASSLDRKRLQAIHAAEAGLDVYLAELPRTPIGSIQCTPGVQTLPLEGGGQYQVTAVFYPTFPGVAGQEMSCPLSQDSPPGGAVITSRGTAVAVGNVRAASRTFQTEVALKPVIGGFAPAIFSDVQFNVNNNLNVYGNVGNDADMYTNGNFVCVNSSLDYGSVNVQGSATLGNSCTVAQDLRVNGNIVMSQSARVGHDATSSTGSISLSNQARIDNNARTGTSCSGCVQGSSVLGTITTNSPSAPPPAIQMPTVNWVPSAWTAAGYTIASFADCTAAKNHIQNVVSGSTISYAVRITTPCALVFDSSATVTLGANLAIVTNGSISTANHSRFLSSDGTIREMHFIVPRELFTPATPPDARATNCPATANNINLVNNTDFVNVQTFLYTPCTINLNNNNLGHGGQIFGQNVNINNHFSFTYRPMLIPGAGNIIGFNTDIAYLREITNA